MRSDFPARASAGRRAPGVVLAAAVVLASVTGALAAVRGAVVGAPLRPMPYAADAFPFAVDAHEAPSPRHSALVEEIAVLAGGGPACAAFVVEGGSSSAGQLDCRHPARRLARVDPAVALRAE